MNDAFTRFAGEGGDNALIDEGEFCEMVETELKLENRSDLIRF